MTADAPDDPLAPVRANADAIEAHLAPRDDRLGAAARYLLALARGDDPDPTDRAVVETYGAGGDEFGRALNRANHVIEVLVALDRVADADARAID